LPSSGTTLSAGTSSTISTASEWRAEGAYPAIVDQALFLRAREIVDARSHHFSDEDLLDALRTILKRQGILLGLIIDEEDALPSSNAYRSRFGIRDADTKFSVSFDTVWASEGAKVTQVGGPVGGAVAGGLGLAHAAPLTAWIRDVNPSRQEFCNNAGLIRPVPEACATKDASWGEKCLFSRQNQADLHVSKNATWGMSVQGSQSRLDRAHFRREVLLNESVNL
jgi:hypothetical protein